MSERIEIVAELRDMVSNHLRNIDAQISRMDSNIRNVGGGQGSGQGLFGQIVGANLLTNAIQKTGSAIYDFGNDSVDAYAKQEVYESRLTTLLGDRKQAELAIANIRRDAAKTPFDVSSLVQGNSMLIGAGAGAKEARKVTMDLGNAIAATGGGSDELSRMIVNLGQIKSIGKASAMDIRQFAFANIPIYQMLSKTMGKSVAQLKDMDITYKDLTKSLAEARKEGGMFFHGLENASQTLEGLKSNMNDAIDTFKVNIGENFADNLKGAMSVITEGLTDWNEKLGLINQTARNLKKGGVDFKFSDQFSSEGMSDKAVMAGYQKKLNDQTVFGANGEKERNAVKANINKEIASITEKYQRDRQIYEYDKEEGGGSQAAPDSRQYLQKITLLKDALDTLTSQSKADKKDKESSKEPKKLETLAKANRPNQTVINIENLVREFMVTTNNMKEAPAQVEEMIAKVLIGAVNDISVLPN